MQSTPFLPGAAKLPSDLADLDGCIGHHIWEPLEKYSLITHRARETPVFSFRVIAPFQRYCNTLLHGYDSYGWNPGTDASSTTKEGKGYLEYHYYGEGRPAALEIKHRWGQYYVAVGDFAFNSDSHGWLGGQSRLPNRLNIVGTELGCVMRSQKTPGGMPISGNLVDASHRGTEVFGDIRLSLDDTGILYRDGDKPEAVPISYALLRIHLRRAGVYKDPI